MGRGWSCKRSPRLRQPLSECASVLTCPPCLPLSAPSIDHSPLERARIEATPHGRVKQTPGGARLLDGSLGWQEAMHAKTLGLSRALGDTGERVCWAVGCWACGDQCSSCERGARRHLLPSRSAPCSSVLQLTHSDPSCPTPAPQPTHPWA